MNRFRVILSLAATLGLFAYGYSRVPVYAASDGMLSGGAGQASGASASSADGAKVYASHCAMCHGEGREGRPPAIPSLLGVGGKMTNQQITDIVHKGKSPMPAFPTLPPEEMTALLHYLTGGQTKADSTGAVGSNAGSAQTHSSSLSAAGGALFQQNCAFCHGRDAGGGESGPDLTRSKLVITDVAGDKISEVVRNGRPLKNMPSFNLSSQELLNLAAFIHEQEAKAVAKKGNRRGVDAADLQTGDKEAGKKYFNGAGGCAACHSATGDLAGIASRLEGLKLEQRMLYPSDAKSRLTVTLPSGEKIEGTLAYRDEFTVGMQDHNGSYRSWPANLVKYVVDSPVEAHVALFPKYTDADIHNLMAYIQTLR